MFKPGWYPNQRLYSWKMFEKVWDDWFTGLGHLPWISLAAFPRKKIEHMCALCSHQLQAGRIFFISMRMALACALTKRQAFTCGQGVCAIVQAGPNVCMAREVLAGMLFFYIRYHFSRPSFWRTQFFEILCGLLTPLALDILTVRHVAHRFQPWMLHTWDTLDWYYAWIRCQDCKLEWNKWEIITWTTFQIPL